MATKDTNHTKKEKVAIGTLHTTFAKEIRIFFRALSWPPNSAFGIKHHLSNIVTCWLVGIFILAFPGCAHQQLPPDSFLMVQLMSERLSLAKDVAQAKWAAGLPIRDRERETFVVLRFVEQADAAGLHPGLAQRLMQSQIEASCLEQDRWIKQWNNGENPPQSPTPDLELLRQKLDRLSSRIIAEWAAIEGDPLPAAALRAQLVQDGYSLPAATAAAAFAR